MTKRTVSLFLILALTVFSALLLVSCSGSADGAPEGMKLISGEDADYLFYVPSGSYWIGDVKTGATTAYYSNTDTSNVSVMDFTVNATDYTAEDWWNSFQADFKNTYRDFTVVSSESAVLDGVDALRTVFTGKMTVGVDPSTGEDVEREYKFMQISAIKKGTLSAPKAYVFTYTSLNDGETYEAHIDDVEKMVENFKFN